MQADKRDTGIYSVLHTGEKEDEKERREGRQTFTTTTYIFNGF
jgi:hypothetical protein